MQREYLHIETHELGVDGLQDESDTTDQYQREGAAMCLRSSSILGWSSWNWSGDEVVPHPVVPASRKLPNSDRSYPIDIREFLTTTKNEVVRHALDDAVRSLPTAAERELFLLRTKGAFDHRVRVLAEYVAQNIAYQSRDRRHPDVWQFPEETLALGAGDCEDQAFLLAALLLAAGVSGYMVRVALGQLVERKPDGSRGTSRDHVWVVYLDEQGRWLVLDPLLYFRESPKATVSPPSGDDEHAQYEYVPSFVFNDAHLWAVRRVNGERTLADFLDRRQFFRHFDPGFAASVHNHIFDEALQGMSWFKRQYVKAVSLAVDGNVATYDPRDHFDNGYIVDGFALVAQRLASKSLGDFALAAHALGDFYAHSTYGVFGQIVDGRLAVYDPKHPLCASVPDYGDASPCPLADPRFTVNTGTYHGSRADAAAHWKGKLISGRYAQNGDPKQGVFERITYIPSVLRARPDYTARAMLPHHDEITVDGPSMGSNHRLYRNAAGYATAFAQRQAAAIEHIRAVYQAWK